MRRKKRTEVTIETDEIFIIRPARQVTSACCPQCAGQVAMVTPDEAAAITCVSSRAIFRWVEAGKLHFTEASDGRIFICLNSLSHHDHAADCPAGHR